VATGLTTAYMSPMAGSRVISTAPVQLPGAVTTAVGTSIYAPASISSPMLATRPPPQSTMTTLEGPLTAPPRLTSGLPDPGAIAKQREAYIKALEEQERQAIAVLEQQRAQQVSLLRAQGDQQKQKFFLEVNQQVSQNDIVLTQTHSEQMMLLNQQYSQQRGTLENQANALIMEYQQKKAQEDMMMQQYELQLTQHNGQQKYNEDMVKLQGQQERVQGALAQAYASSYMPPSVMRQNTYLPSVTSVGVGPINSYQPVMAG